MAVMPKAVCVATLPNREPTKRGRDGCRRPVYARLEWHKTTLALAQVALIWMEMLTLFLIIAGIFGAAGIALAAAGAHAAPNAGLDSAANILLFHALAILGGTDLLLQGMLSRQLALIALAAWALGTILFSDDVVLRALLGTGSYGRVDGRNYLDSSLAGLGSCRTC